MITLVAKSAEDKNSWLSALFSLNSWRLLHVFEYICVLLLDTSSWAVLLLVNLLRTCCISFQCWSTQLLAKEVHG